MSKRNTLLLLLALCLIVTLVGTGCPKKKTAEEPPPPAPVETPKEPPAPKEPPKQEVTEKFKPDETEPARVIDQAFLDRLSGQMQTVYFAFDKSDLTDDARAKIRGNAQLLKDNPEVKVVIQGHCDERGTIEYNLALGERRAKAVRDYMTSLGVQASRVRVVSYGEERPAVQGHNESAWSKNRRGEFKAEK